MKNNKQPSESTKVSCRKVTRLTSRQLHYQLFQYMRSENSDCLVVTHLGVPRMLAVFVDPQVGYSVLAGIKDLEIEIKK
jgi:hypothetical protein